MEGGEQVRTPPLIQDRIQMDGATTALGTANPLYPGVPVDIMHPRATRRGGDAPRRTAGSSRRTLC